MVGDKTHRPGGASPAPTRVSPVFWFCGGGECGRRARRAMPLRLVGRLWVLGGGVFGVFQVCVEGGAVVEAAVGDDGGDFAGVVDVGERIGVEQDEVGDFAFGDGALGGFGGEKFGGVAGGGLQGFHRG